MRILITGGFGLIGGRVGAHLQNIGHEIILGTRHHKKNPHWLIGGGVIEIDYVNIDSMEKALTNVDLVIYASGMSATQSLESSDLAYETKRIELENLALVAKKNKIRVIYISSAHVYRNPLVGYISEETTTSNSHPYARSHVIGERVLLNSELDVAIVRLANAFGYPAYENINCWTLLVNDLCKQVINTGAIRLSSQGLQYRNFIDISAVCSVFEGLVKIQFMGRKIYNLGSDKSMSVIDMAKLVQERARVAINIAVKIHINKDDIGLESDRLDFKSDNLRKIGIYVEASIEREVDLLLQYCGAKFKCQDNWGNGIKWPPL